MSEPLILATGITDFGELAEAFSARVDDNRIIIPSGLVREEGERVEFSILLADGSAGLSGVGFCTLSMENENAQYDEERYDIVLDHIELDAMNSAVFERIMATRAGNAQEQPVVSYDTSNEETAIGDIRQLLGEDPTFFAPEPAPLERPHAEITGEVDFESDSTQLAPIEPARAVVDDAPRIPSVRPPVPSAPPPAPSVPPLRAVSAAPPAIPPARRAAAPNGLARPSLDAQWSASMVPPAQPSGHASEFFAYGAGVLPAPSDPPRPEMEVAIIVPAPRPGDAQNQLLDDALAYAAAIAASREAPPPSGISSTVSVDVSV